MQARLAGDVRPFLWAWRGALAFFVLAGLTGAWFRFSAATGLLLGLDPGHLRHAHSHTMYFGWATPALMALVAGWLPALGAPHVRGAGIAIGAAFATALVAYPPFLLWGYGRAPIGADGFPVSVIASGLNVLAWYAFVAAYVGTRRRMSRGEVRAAADPLALRLFDLALGFLVLATLGAWGLPVLQVLGVDRPALAAALTHVFLDLFSEGWFVLAVLGVAAAEASRNGGGVPPSVERVARTWGVRLIAAGLPFTFALGMAPALVPPTFGALARVGGALVAVGTLALVTSLWPRLPGRLWRFALACLAAKAMAEAAVSVAPGLGWASHPTLRVLYLHLMLLGFVSVGLVAAARSAWGGRAAAGREAFAAAVALLLVSLVPLTPWWPAAWAGRWTYLLAALLALGPPLVALRMAAARRR